MDWSAVDYCDVLELWLYFVWTLKECCFVEELMHWACFLSLCLGSSSRNPSARGWAVPLASLSVRGAPHHVLAAHSLNAAEPYDLSEDWRLTRPAVVRQLQHRLFFCERDANHTVWLMFGFFPDFNDFKWRRSHYWIFLWLRCQMMSLTVVKLLV